jgi:hypothetical protein
VVLYAHTYGMMLILTYVLQGALHYSTLVAGLADPVCAAGGLSAS